MKSQKQQNDLSSFPRRTVRYHSYPSQCPTPLKLKKLKLTDFYEDLQHLLELTPKIDTLFIIGDWNAKVGSQEILGKFGLGVQNEAGQRLTVLSREHTGHSKSTLFQ